MQPTLTQLDSLYYSKESFDDFYIGKGSTYPDVNGSVAFCSSKPVPEGHAQKTISAY